ncbi:hypothetical protein FRB96_009570 [Tulasnella sp. 330]|nr:hypothetical protein FRB96_009570 [Tulasnella sp. 330]
MVRRPGHRDLPKSVKAAMKNEPSMIEDADHTYVKVLERNWRYQPTSIMRTRVSRKGAASEAVLIVKRGKGMTVFRVQSPRPIGPMGSPVEVKEISGYGDPGSFRGMMVDGRSTTLEPEAAFNALSAVPRYPYYETVEPKAELARLASVMEGLRVAYLRDQAAERGAVERT